MVLSLEEEPRAFFFLADGEENTEEKRPEYRGEKVS